DSVFSGDLMAFNLTSSQTGKSWLEDQILKPLGLYWIVRANGQMTLKSMKPPASTSPVAINQRQIVGIPQIDRWDIINVMNTSVLIKPEDSDVLTFCYANNDSLQDYKNTYQQAMDSDGLMVNFGGGMRTFSLAARTFNRHGFATPQYTMIVFFENTVLELGDF